MAKKAPVNSSLAYAVIAAGSQAALFYLLSRGLLPGVSFSLSGFAPTAGALCTGAAVTMLLHDHISRNPVRRLKVAFENCGIYIQREPASGYRSSGARKLPTGWRLYYKLYRSCKNISMKTGGNQRRWTGRFRLAAGLLMVDVLQARFCRGLNCRRTCQVKLVYGWLCRRAYHGRPGILPSLLVGQTGGGKSNFRIR